MKYVFNPFTGKLDTVVSSGDVNHNDLSGLQGGTAGEYYHLTSAQYTVVGNTSGTNTGDVTLASPNHGLGLTNQVITLGTPSTLTSSTTNAIVTTSHTHAITSSANPGAAASILASTADGYLQLTRLGIGASPVVPLTVSSSDGTPVRFSRTGLTAPGDYDFSISAVLPESDTDITLDCGTTLSGIVFRPRNGLGQNVMGLGINRNGNVVIGHTGDVTGGVSPQPQLLVASTIGCAIYVWGNDDNVGAEKMARICFGQSGIVSEPTRSWSVGMDSSGLFQITTRANIWADTENIPTAVTINTSGQVSIGAAGGIPLAKLHVGGSTEQLRLEYDSYCFTQFTIDAIGSLNIVSNSNPGTTNENITLTPGTTGQVILNRSVRHAYDASNYDTFTVGSTGSLTVAATGTNPNIALTPGGTGYTLLNGNVGVGTATPGAKIHILGGNRTQLLLDRAGSQANRLALFVGDGTGGYTVDENYISSINTTLHFLAGGSGTTEIVTFLSDGNVGIGATSPVGRFQVQSAASSVDNTYFTTNDFVNFSTGSTFNIAFGAASGNTYTNLRALSAGGSAWNNLVLQWGGGNVGIGTTSPLSKLHVAETSTSSPRGIVNSQHNTGAEAARFEMMKSRGTSSSPTTIATGDTLSNISTWGYDGSNYLNMGALVVAAEGTVASTRIPTNMKFFTATNAAPSVLTERMRIDSAGNVGIGITAPSTKLQIYSDAIPEIASATPLGAFSIKSSASTAMVFGIRPTSPYEGMIQMRHGTVAGGYYYPLSLQPLGGNVGIGIVDLTNTLASLTVSKQSATDHRLLFLQNGYVATNGDWTPSGLGMGYSATFDDSSSHIVNYSRPYNQYGSKLYIQTHSNTSGVWNTGIIMDELGNIGIGMTPTSPFSVYAPPLYDAMTVHGNGTTSTDFHIIGGTGDAGGISWRAYAIGTNFALSATNVPTIIGADAGYTHGNAIGFGVEDSTDTGITFWTGAGVNTAMTEKMRITNGGNVGIGVTPTYKLQVNGQPAANGYTAWTNYSDARLKENIKPLGNGYLEKIMQLQPSTFNYNELTGYDQKTRNRTIAGFIAQEIKPIFPEMVGETLINGKTYYDTDLSALQIYLVKGMQEQQKEIVSLKQQVSSQQQEIDELKKAVQEIKNQL